MATATRKSSHVLPRGAGRNHIPQEDSAFALGIAPAPTPTAGTMVPPKRSLWERLSGMLRSSKAGTLEERLAALERKAEATPSMYRALVYKQAGDLCAAEDARERALRFYGQAIDAYIETGFFDSAAVVCRKVIELSPSVVRARCTLAFLSLGKGLLYLPFEGLAADARREIGDYVHAAQQQRREDLAVKRLHLMADATDSHEIREMIGEYLMELGDYKGADDVLGGVFAERNLVRPPPTDDQRERWAHALSVSIVEQRNKARLAGSSGDAPAAEPAPPASTASAPTPDASGNDGSVEGDPVDPAEPKTGPSSADESAA